MRVFSPLNMRVLSEEKGRSSKTESRKVEDVRGSRGQKKRPWTRKKNQNAPSASVLLYYFTDNRKGIRSPSIPEVFNRRDQKVWSGSVFVSSSKKFNVEIIRSIF